MHAATALTTHILHYRPYYTYAAQLLACACIVPVNVKVCRRVGAAARTSRRVTDRPARADAPARPGALCQYRSSLPSSGRCAVGSSNLGIGTGMGAPLVARA